MVPRMLNAWAEGAALQARHLARLGKAMSGAVLGWMPRKTYRIRAQGGKPLKTE